MSESPSPKDAIEALERHKIESHECYLRCVRNHEALYGNGKDGIITTVGLMKKDITSLGKSQERLELYFVTALRFSMATFIGIILQIVFYFATK